METTKSINGKKVKLINGKQYTRRLFVVATDFEIWEYTSQKASDRQLDRLINCPEGSYDDEPLSQYIRYDKLEKYHNGYSKEYVAVHIETQFEKE